MASEKPTWIKVPPESLSETLKAKYAALVKASAAQRNAEAEFEAAFISASQKAKKVPEGKKILFGYRYGGLAVALVDRDEEKEKKGKSAGSWF